MKTKAKELNIPICGSGTSEARRHGSEVCPAWIPTLVLCFLMLAMVGIGQADSQSNIAATGETKSPTLSVADGGILSHTDPGATLAEVTHSEWFSWARLKSRLDQTSLIHIFKKGWPDYVAADVGLDSGIGHGDRAGILPAHRTAPS